MIKFLSTNLLFIFFLLSCSSIDRVITEPELSISNKLSKFKEFEKYDNVYAHESLVLSDMTLYYVKSYKTKNKYISFFALSFFDDLYINLHKVDGVVLEPIKLNQFENSLAKIQTIDNDTIIDMLKKVRKGVLKSENIKDNRKHGYRP